MNQNNVVYEEDIEVAFQKCIDVLGPIGKYDMDGEYTVLYTPEHGKLWYGDLNNDDIEYRIPALTKVLGVAEIFASK